MPRGRPRTGLVTKTVPLPPDLVEAARRIAERRRLAGTPCVYGDLVRRGLELAIAEDEEEQREPLLAKLRPRVLPNIARIVAPPIGIDQWEIGTRIADKQGEAVVDQWLRELQAAEDNRPSP